MSAVAPIRDKTKYALRNQRRATGRGMFAGSSYDVDGTSADLAGEDHASAGTHADASGESFEVISDAEPVADNDDVWKKRFYKRGMSRLRRNIRRAWKWLDAVWAFIGDLRSETYTRDEKIAMLKQFRRWDPEGLEVYRRIRDEEALFLFHKKQAQELKLRIIEVLTNLGYCHKVTKNDKIYVKKKISVAQVDVSPYAYTYHLNKMPFGVSVTQVAQDDVSVNISASIGKRIRYELDMQGLRFTVEVGSTLSIPNFVGFKEMDKTPIPKNHPPLALWFGTSVNGKPIYRNLASAPHMIIAGSSGGGKSNMDNMIICTLLQRNSPNRLKIVLIDAKRGVEFSTYEGIPHLLKMERGDWKNDGIVERPEDILPTLEWLWKECDDRLETFRKAKARDIASFNRTRRKNPMPFIVVMFDEWATARDEVGEKGEKLLAKMANQSRAAGIHIILSTQYPKAEILNTRISANFPWRLAFNMPAPASHSVLNSQDAFMLTPKGRAILLTSDSIQVQTPRIVDKKIQSVVETAITGKSDLIAENVDENDILEWALRETSGKLDHDSVYNQFKDKISREPLRALLKSMENNIFEVEETLYKVLPNEPGRNLGRRMVLAEEPAPDADEAAGGTRHEKINSSETGE